MAPPNTNSNTSSSSKHQTKNDLITSFNVHKLLTLGSTSGDTSSNNGRIESLYAYSDKILVGLNNGTLLVYTIDDPLSPTPGRATLWKTLKKFAPKAIEKIGVVKDAGSLIVLSDNIVHVYDLDSWTLDETLGKTKGATNFEITFGVKKGKDQETESESDEEANTQKNDTGYMSTVTRLVVASKRKLLCYEWQDSEFLECKEVLLPDKIRSLSFANVDKVVVGLSSDYCIVDIPTSSISNVTLPGSHSHSSGLSSYIGIGIGGKSPFPHSVALPDETTLLVKDTTSEFVNISGDLIIDRPALPLTAPLDHLGYCYPYIITVNPKMIEVRNPTTSSLLQSIDLHNIKSVHWGKVAYVATFNQVYLLQSTSLHAQVKTLAEHKHLSEAISILESIDPAHIPDKSNLLRDYKIKKAQRMITRNKEFEQALALFSEVSASPDLVVELFPLSISGTAEDLISYTDTVVPTRRILQRYASSVPSSGASTPRPRPGKARKSDINFPTDSNVPSLLASNNTEGGINKDSDNAAEGADKKTQKSDKKDGTGKDWTDKELATAIRFLLNYLADTRRKISLITSHLVPSHNKDNAKNDGNDSDSSKESKKSQSSALSRSSSFEGFFDGEQIISNGVVLTPDIFGDLKQAAGLVDTTMFKCYIIQSPALIGPLLRIHNNCDPVIVKTVLAHAGRWSELIDFYFGKKLHREALELLKFLAVDNSVNSPTTNPNTDVGDYNTVNSKSVPDYLRGPEPTVQYLQRLNNTYIDIIFEFAKYPIQLNEEFGVDIFLEDTTESESLDRAKVLVFLESMSRSLSVKYLEHLIHRKNEANAYFHTALAIDYIKEMVEHFRLARKGHDSLDDSNANEPPTSQLLNQKYGKFGQQTSADAAAAVEQRNKSLERAQDIFARLVSFLQNNDSKYRLQKVLSSLPSRNLNCSPEELEVKAILYGRQGEIRSALLIYTFALKDDSKARAFCSKVYDEDVSLGKKALHTLMALYLTPPDYRELDEEEVKIRKIKKDRKEEETDSITSNNSNTGSEDNKNKSGNSGENAPKHPPQRLDLALDLLATQGSRMSVVDIINTLPSTTKIQDIAVFLTSQIRTLRTSWNNSQLDTALRRVNLVKTQEILLKQQQRSVTISSHKTCKVCYKRLGHSVISVFPDNTAIHYGCAKTYQASLDEKKRKEEEDMKKKNKMMKKNVKASISSTSLKN